MVGQACYLFLMKTHALKKSFNQEMSFDCKVPAEIKMIIGQSRQHVIVTQ